MGHEVQQTRWDRLLRRASGSIGPGSRVSETLSELFPVFNVESPPAELLVLGGTHMAMGFTSEPGVVANFQVSQLFNPVGSAAIITLTSLSISTDTSATFDLGLTEGSFTTDHPTQKGFVDGRLIAVNTPIGQVREETAGAAGVSQYRLTLEIAESNIFMPPHAVAVLSPGTGFSVGTAQTNTTLEVGYTWTERPAEPSELSL